MSQSQIIFAPYYASVAGRPFLPPASGLRTALHCALTPPKPKGVRAHERRNGRPGTDSAI